MMVSDSGGDQRRSYNDIESLIPEILALLSKVSERLEPENDEMKQWMAENFHNPVIIELLQDTTFMMLRVLDAVGRSEPVNGITISKQYRIPKGTVSKTTRRLIAQKLITKEALPNNKKEVLFRLTPLGRELFEAHRAFDQQMEKGFVQFLHRYNADELQFMVRLLQDVADASFLNPELNVAAQAKTPEH
jgi:DNA-binding MarR family transcriptional regulator